MALNENNFILSLKTFSFVENFFLDGFISITGDLAGSCRGNANACNNLFGSNRSRDNVYPD
jgi:hypothetical protein